MKCQPEKPSCASSVVYSPFPETHWSVVLRAGPPDGKRAGEALETLCRSYWYPLYAFARKQGSSPEAAKDLTQSFFEVFIGKNLVGKAEAEKGRFRSFLLVSFRNFLSHQREHDGAQKRGGGQVLISWDQLSTEDRFELELTDSLTPETVYERAWALTVLRGALDRTDREYRRLGEQTLFEHLRVFLQGEVPSISCAEVGRLLGKTTEAIKVAIHRMRKRYRKFLIEELSHTVAELDEIEDELRALRRILSS